MNQHQTTILLVEDDDNDVFFLKLAFEEAGIFNPLQVVTHGGEAIEYLAGQGLFADRARFPLPRLALLDLKLPVRMGFDVLRWIQTRPELHTLLVVVLTSSSNRQDIEQAYRLGARAYLVKPLGLEERVAMARAIKAFWLDLNKFPERRGPDDETARRA